MKDLKFNTTTFGCKINLYESESIIYSLVSKGLIKEKELKSSEIIIINTCTVTKKADAKCRNSIRKARRENPDALIIVCGCLVNTDHDELSKMKEIDILVKNEDKDKIFNVINKYIKKDKSEKPYHYSTSENGCFNYKTSYMSQHSRVFLKIQDGCNNFCSYCKIPYARGREKSKNKNDIFKDIDSFIDNGYEEIVLSGVNLGSYFYEGTDISGLIYELSTRYCNIRFRISSIEPQYIDERFLKSFKLPNICPHIHIPLQNGSDKILKLMNRKYSTKEYLHKIKMLRKTKKDLFISSDLILGFPGETEEDFNNTYDLIKKIDFSFIHLFGYSPREGTKAIDITPKVPERIRDERLKKIKLLVDEMNLNYRTKNIGKVLDVIVERKKHGIYMGKSENYLDMVIVTNKVLSIKKRYKVIFDKIENDKNYCSLVNGEQ